MNTSLKIKEINEEEVMRMASIGCTQAEIAQKFGIHISTLTREYKLPYLKGLASLYELIRQSQIECALTRKGDAAMLMFLGKVYLHQSENKTEEKLADLDLLLEHLERQAKCSSYLENNFKASTNPQPE